MPEPRDADTHLLQALDPDHVATFSAFRRGPRDTDLSLARAPEHKHLIGPGENPALARRVFAGKEGTIDLVPSPGGVKCIAIIAETGETFAGGTTTTIAALDGHGYVRSAPHCSALFVGVLPTGAHDLRAVDRGGRHIPVALSEDDAYWITIVEPIDMFWTRADHTVHQTVFGRFGMHRAILGEEPAP